jgi:hypothetical protein
MGMAISKYRQFSDINTYLENPKMINVGILCDYIHLKKLSYLKNVKGLIDD